MIKLIFEATRAMVKLMMKNKLESMFVDGIKKRMRDCCSHSISFYSKLLTTHFIIENKISNCFSIKTPLYFSLQGIF